jgi:hypothetical protein
MCSIRFIWKTPVKNLRGVVDRAFEEGFVGLRFVFDALTTDNSTGIRQK